PVFHTTEADSRAGYAMLQSARSLMVPKDGRQRDKWQRAKSQSFVGVVTQLNPILLQTEDGIRQFELEEKPAIVNSTPASPAVLRRGKCVTVLSEAGLLPDGTMNAVLLAL